MPHKKQAKKDNDHYDQKNCKKGKAVKPGGNMRMGRGQHENDDDDDDPDLDIDAAMLIQAKSLKKQKIDQASQEHGGARGLSPEDHCMP